MDQNATIEESISSPTSDINSSNVQEKNLINKK
jgi:hypothetical protein